MFYMLLVISYLLLGAVGCVAAGRWSAAGVPF
jgi:hypothetical protein